MFKTDKPVSIFLIAIMQLIVAINLFYIFYIKLHLKSIPAKNIIITVYAIHLIVTAIFLLKLNILGRINSISNLLGLSFFSFIGIFVVGTKKPITLLFCVLYFVGSLYFVFYLNQPKVKQIFGKGI